MRRPHLPVFGLCSGLLGLFGLFGPASAETLTLDAALALARARLPALHQAAAETAAAAARAEQAASGRRPQVQAQASYARQTHNLPDTGPMSRALGAGDASFDTEGTLSAGLSATQLLYDFGRTGGQVEAAEAGHTAAAEGERGARRDAALAVRQAYAEAVGQKLLVEVARSALENQRRHEAQTAAFIQAGTRPPVDGALARSERANAQVSLVNAENAYRSARARLAQACGRTDGIDFEVDETWPGPTPLEATAQTALAAQAEAADPALAALAARRNAQEQTLASVQAGLWPVLDATTSLTESGPDPTALAWNWSGAVRLSWPLYQGGLTTAQALAARHDAAALEAQGEAARQRLWLRLEQARLAVRAGLEASAASDEAVAAAEERLKLAEGRYQTGVGTALELNDAELALTNARGQKIRALRDLASARAELIAAAGSE